MKLTEERIRQAFNTYLEECDADEFARLVGDVFGGGCFPVLLDESESGTGKIEVIYDFEPNSFYAGEFIDIDPSIKPAW